MESDEIETITCWPPDSPGASPSPIQDNSNEDEHLSKNLPASPDYNLTKKKFVRTEISKNQADKAARNIQDFGLSTSQEDDNYCEGSHSSKNSDSTSSDFNPPRKKRPRTLMVENAEYDFADMALVKWWKRRMRENASNDVKCDFSLGAFSKMDMVARYYFRVRYFFLKSV